MNVHENLISKSRNFIEPAFDTVRRTVQTLFLRRAFLLKSILIPVLLTIGLYFLEKYPSRYRSAYDWVFIAGQILTTIMLFVGVHRTVLLSDEEIANSKTRFWGMIETKYLLNAILFILIYYALSYILSFLYYTFARLELISDSRSIRRGISTGISLFKLFVLGVFLSRWSVSFASFSIDKEISLSAAWDFTKQYKHYAFISIVLMPLVVYLALYYPLRWINPFRSVSLTLVATGVGYVLIPAIMAQVYRETMGDVKASNIGKANYIGEGAAAANSLSETYENNFNQLIEQPKKHLSATMTFARALKLIYVKKVVLLKNLLIPFSILLLVALIDYFLVRSKILSIMLYIISTIPIVMFSVTVHRTLLLDNSSFRFWSMSETHYFIKFLVLSLITLVFVAIINSATLSAATVFGSIPIFAIGAIGIVGGILILIALITVGRLFSKWTIAFVSTALDQKMSFNTSSRITKGYVIYCFLSVVFLPLLVYILLYIPFKGTKIEFLVDIFHSILLLATMSQVYIEIVMQDGTLDGAQGLIEVLHEEE